MAITELGYLGAYSDKLDDWSDLAGFQLGMEKIDKGGKSIAFRMDDQAQRLLISGEDQDDHYFLGFRVDCKDDLNTFAARLDKVDIKVNVADRALCDRRLVENMIWFHDFEGNRVELFHAPMLATDPFRPGRPHTGFATEALGMGHAAIHATDVDLLVSLYRDVLGFGVSDYGFEPYKLYFFHVNGRHHSFAMAGSGQRGFHHIMVEYKNLDDMGHGLDIAVENEDRLAYTMGRHYNDQMMSYYSNTPSGFFVEAGWGGLVVDPETWEPHETTTGPSSWGHDRLYMPEDSPLRKRLHDMKREAADRGDRCPPMVDCPWLFGQLAN